jgi:hypothetical protein
MQAEVVPESARLTLRLEPSFGLCIRVLARPMQDVAGPQSGFYMIRFNARADFACVRLQLY